MKKISVTSMAMLFLLVLLVLPSCINTVKLAEVPRDRVPQKALELIAVKTLGKTPSNVVWRVVHETEDCLWVAATFDLEMPDGKVQQMYWIWYKTKNREGGAATSPIDSSRQFYGFLGSNRSPDRPTMLDAGGMALDKRIAKIRGTTTAGATKETQPVDGFWFMTYVTQELNEDWKVVEALNADGKVLYEIKKVAKPGQVRP